MTQGDPWLEPRSRLSVLVLAAGRGRRLESVATAFAGEPVPKQYCTFGGARSLLQETIDRFARTIPTSRMTVIVDRRQTTRAEAQLRGYRDLGVVVQPEDRGTAAGVLLTLWHAMRRDPDATVVITPSDHGIQAPAVFLERVDAARRHVDDAPEHVVLLGADATYPSTDYGWIVPRPDGGDALARAVFEFAEKPNPARAHALMESGGLWSTMVAVARAERLWRLFEETVPALVGRFAAMPGRLESASGLASLYASLEAADFSRDVLGRASGLVVMSLPSIVGWSDLGTPSRLMEWLETRGVRTEGFPEPAAASERVMIPAGRMLHR